MNKSPLNYLLTIAFGAISWVILAIILAPYLSESPTLATKDPSELAVELQYVFGIGVLSSIISACSWYTYGGKESTAGNLTAAKKRWNTLLVSQIIVSVTLISVLVFLNRLEGIEASWFAFYYGIGAFLTFILFWLTTFLMSPKTVKLIPLGR